MRYRLTEEGTVAREGEGKMLAAMGIAAMEVVFLLEVCRHSRNYPEYSRDAAAHGRGS